MRRKPPKIYGQEKEGKEGKEAQGNKEAPLALRPAFFAGHPLEKKISH